MRKILFVAIAMFSILIATTVSAADKQPKIPPKPEHPLVCHIGANPVDPDRGYDEKSEFKAQVTVYTLVLVIDGDGKLTWCNLQPSDIVVADLVTGRWKRVLKCGNDLYGEPHFTKPPKPEPSKKEVPPVTIPPQGNPPEDKKLPPAPPATTTKEEEQIDLLPYLGGFVGTKIIGPEAGLIVGKHSIVSLGFGLAKRSRVHRRTHEECVSWEESMSSAKGVQPLWPCIPTEWVDEGVSFGHDFVVQAGWAYLWPKGFFAGGGLEHQERSGDFEGSSFINGKYLRVGYTRRNLIVHLDYTRSDIPDRGPVTVTRDVSWYDGQYHKLVDYTFPSISGGHDDRITVMAGWVWF